MSRPAIFFDFGGTLVRARPDMRPSFAAAAERVGVRLPLDAFVAANDTCWEELWPDAPGLVGRRPGFADRVHARALRRVGVETSVDALVRAIREEALSPRWQTPFPETVPTLSRLRDDGYALHVISGHVDYLPLILRNLGWADRFATVTFTQEVGVQKPDPRVFRFALRRARCAAADAVYVGDSWTADYRGARGVGMEAVWVNRDGAAPPEPCASIADLTELPARLVAR